ncbi:MAG: transcriptional regulator FNR [Gammaproteobacteria bacterium]|nr:helix-turn-helix domain-containing protein [Gammaproteobacteria bacterium]PCH63600.1 MAG: transcriptional regulator FNR [Gammaproteobacteria bacterium]
MLVKNNEWFSQPKNHCANCPSARYCLAHGLSDGEVAQFSRKIKHPRPRHKGEKFFMMGDSFNSFAMVHSGCVKSYVTSRGGEHQIIGFYMPGDILGLDGIASGEHRYTAEALETTSICELAFRDYEDLCNCAPSLQWRLLDALSQKMVAEQKMLLMLGKMTSEQRLANFLLDLSSCMAARGMSAQTISLPMSRSDIANYLGLVIETVSRLFSRFQVEGVLTVQRRIIGISDRTRLQAIAYNNCEDYCELDRVA